jgi:hypothetical protein
MQVPGVIAGTYAFLKIKTFPKFMLVSYEYSAKEVMQLRIAIALTVAVTIGIAVVRIFAEHICRKQDKKNKAKYETAKGMYQDVMSDDDCRYVPVYDEKYSKTIIDKVVIENGERLIIEKFERKTR